MESDCLLKLGRWHCIRTPYAITAISNIGTKYPSQWRLVSERVSALLEYYFPQYVCLPIGYNVTCQSFDQRSILTIELVRITYWDSVLFRSGCMWRVQQEDVGRRKWYRRNFTAHIICNARIAEAKIRTTKLCSSGWCVELFFVLVGVPANLRSIRFGRHTYHAGIPENHKNEFASAPTRKPKQRCALNSISTVYTVWCEILISKPNPRWIFWEKSSKQTHVLNNVEMDEKTRIAGTRCQMGDVADWRTAWMSTKLWTVKLQFLLRISATVHVISVAFEITNSGAFTRAWQWSWFP